MALKSLKLRSVLKTPIFPIRINISDSIADGRIIVYTDGSCLNNGQANARGGYGLHWPHAPNLDTFGHLSAISTTDVPVTSQRAELYAVKAALRSFVDMPLEIRTDSLYVVLGATCWIHEWRRMPHRKLVNRDLFNSIYELVSNRKAATYFCHVSGHVGIKGNEIAHRLANMGSLHLSSKV